MEGNTWGDNGDGTYTVDYLAQATYSDLDLYLMGFIGPEEVEAQSLLLVADDEQTRVGREPASAPEAFNEAYEEGAGEAITVTGTKVDFTVDNIVSAEGERIPAAADSPRNFRMAFLVIVLADDAPDAAELDAVDTVRTTFEADWEADVRGLADLDTTLGDGDAPAFGEVLDTAEPPDSGDTADTGEEAINPEKKACGCATGSGDGAAWAAALALGLLVARRGGAR
jgi:MYXO-CTERM domain-containing protein